MLAPSIRSVVVCGALVAQACAPKVGPSASHMPSPAPASTRSRAVTQEDGWSSLSWEERHDRMTWVVHPNMARLFQRFEQTEAPELTCRTCHGADAEQVQYKMPHGLPALDPRRLPDPTGEGATARVARFMFDEVTPTMADLLGVAPYDPRTGAGFGCFGCHPARPTGAP